MVSIPKNGPDDLTEDEEADQESTGQSHDDMAPMDEETHAAVILEGFAKSVTVSDQGDTMVLIRDDGNIVALDMEDIIGLTDWRLGDDHQQAVNRCINAMQSPSRSEDLPREMHIHGSVYPMQAILDEERHLGSIIDILVLDGDKITVFQLIPESESLEESLRILSEQLQLVASALQVRPVFVQGIQSTFSARHEDTPTNSFESPLRESDRRRISQSIQFKRMVYHPELVDPDISPIRERHPQRDPAYRRDTSHRVLEELRRIEWDTVTLWRIASYAWKALYQLRRRLADESIAIDNSVYLEQRLRRFIREFHQESGFHFVVAVVQLMSPEYAPWDPKWFVSKTQQSVSSDPIACLRWFLCVAPAQELEHSLCDWHRNQAIKRWVEGQGINSNNDGGNPITGALTSLGYAVTPAAMVHALKRLKQAVRPLSNSRTSAVLKYAARHLHPDNIRTWAMISRQPALDQTNNKSENLFKQLNTFDGSKHVFGALRGLMRLVGGPGKERSFSKEKQLAFIRNIVVRAD